LYPLFILAAESPPFQSVLVLKIYYAFAFVSYHHVRISCKYVSIWLEECYVHEHLHSKLDATDDFYCRSYCLLNMFRAPLCPSSGA